MADEKLDDAVEVFEQALRIEPDNVEVLMKLGYARFHLEDHNEALKVYDKVLEVDVTNPEAWNLKGLVHYEQKKYAQALDAVNKAIESDKTYGMAWYNKACFLVIVKPSTRVITSIETFHRN